MKTNNIKYHFFIHCQDNYTPLHLVAVAGVTDEHLRIADLLINNGADINANNGLTTALDLANDDRSKFIFIIS